MTYRSLKLKFKQPTNTKLIEKRLEAFILNMVNQINKNSSIIKSTDTFVKNDNPVFYVKLNGLCLQIEKTEESLWHRKY